MILESGADDLYSEDHLETIDRHLGERLDAYQDWAPYNTDMIERQRAIMYGEIEATQYDIAWMQHELIESKFMDARMGAEAAHLKTLEAQGLENWDVWPVEIYWKYRDYLGNLSWDEAINSR